MKCKLYLESDQLITLVFTLCRKLSSLLHTKPGKKQKFCNQTIKGKMSPLGQIDSLTAFMGLPNFG